MFKFSKIKNILLVIFLLVIYILFSAKSYSNAVLNDLANNILRLHVIANSDSSEDQELKLKVRDSILEYMQSISKECKTKEDAISLLNDNLDTIQKLAKETIISQGYDYDVNVSISQCTFPTKYYGDISLPAGIYDALQVKIGDAQGKNWWCVMFPPLCFVDVSSGIVPEDSKELLKTNLSDEDYSIISDNSKDVKIKFKLLELFGSN